MKQGSGNRSGRIKTIAERKEKSLLFIVIIMALHIAAVFYMQRHSDISGDGIFSYTLANNPYSFEYIDATYPKFPASNGWIDAHILRESYIVEDYDCFNYSSAYFHQRIDNHPLLYYFLVHTVCSLFKGNYSSFYVMVINLCFIFGVDILSIRFVKKLYGKFSYAAVLFAFFFLSVVMQKLYVLPRMYMALAFFCFWYLYIQWDLISNEKWKKADLIKMSVCILGGTQTHYYFYVYVFSLTIFMMVYLGCRCKKYELLNYIYAGIVGVAASWILFPWVIWHIFFNQMGKHTTITPWSVEKLKSYVIFLNNQLFNGRGGIALLFIVALYIASVVWKKDTQKEMPKLKLFRWMVLGSGFFYSFIIFTLDETVWYYMTSLYLTFILWFSMVLISLAQRMAAGIQSKGKEEIVITALSVVCAVSILSVSAVKDWMREYFDMSGVISEFRDVAEEYRQYDCIFVEENQDNTFQNLWFEFGNYDEFKKILLEDFRRNGIREEDLAGRKDNSGLILYAPLEYIDGQEYQLLAAKRGFGIYKIADEAAE